MIGSYKDYEAYEDDTDPRAKRLRYTIYALLITTALGSVAGRILAVNSVDQARLEEYRIAQRMDVERKKLDAERIFGAEANEHLEKLKARLYEALRLQRPFLSSNDRSRWAATRALVEHGTFEIDQIIEEPGWDTIDKVQHKGADGKWHLYSSKPPLLGVLMAVPYAAITKLTGMTLATHPYTVARIMLILINGTALMVFMIFAVKMVERWGESDWAKVFVVAVACWATFLNTFAVVINNHIIAAACAMVAMYATLRIWRDEQKQVSYAIAAGACGALTVAHELPAASLWCVLCLAVAWRTPENFLRGFLPWSVVVGAMFFGTNYVAHESFRPPYAHRGLGHELFELDAELRADLDESEISSRLTKAFADAGVDLSGSVLLEPYNANVKGKPAGDRKAWLITDYDHHDRYPIVAEDGRLAVHAWDNWYDYTYTIGGRVRESYWRESSQRSKIDQGESSRWKYALHVLIGHHGIFSLTPVWILSMIGIVLLLRESDPDVRWTAIFVAVLSFVCIAFYITRPLDDRNYGGMTSAFRWLFWLAPLWLWTMLPTAEYARRRKLWRGIALALLGLSVMSAAYPTWNPWTHPWMYHYFESLGWL